MVSAPAIARERNIQVSEVRHDQPSDYQTLVRLTVVTEEGTQAVSGTLIHGTKPRVVEIEGIPLEAELGRHMLFLRNEDKPGIVGKVGSTLGDAGINIATFHLGRSASGGDAILLTEVDQPLTPEILGKVTGLPHVLQATVLQF
jgi:D-3-phosphoglycerate dehydrogenase